MLLPFVLIFYYVFVEKNKIITWESGLLIVNWILIVSFWYMVRSSGTDGPSSDEFGFNLFLKNLPVVPEMISKFFLPFDLSVLPSYGQFKTYSGLFLLVAALASGLFIKTANKRFLMFSAIWMILFILPSMFVRHASADEFFDFLDCRLYVPVLGILLFTLEIVPRKYFDFSRIATIVVVSIIAVFLAVFTIIQNRKYEEPLVFWHTAAKENPDKPMIWNVLGENYRLDKDFTNAEPNFYKAASLNPENEKYFQNLSHAVMQLPDPAGKIHLFDSIAKKFPRSHYSYYYPAIILLKENVPDQALEYAKKTVEVNPDFKNGYAALFNIYVQMDSLEKSSVIAYELAAKGDSSFLAKTYFNLSDNLFKTGKIEEAIELIKSGLKLEPDNISGRINLAIAYLQLNNFDLAEKIIKETLEKHPNNLSVHTFLFKVYISRPDKMEEARRQAERIKQLGGNISPEDAQLLSKYK